MPLVGHIVIAAAPSCPNSEFTAPSTISTGTGNSAKSHQAQHQPTKNITSDAMHRIMPYRRLCCTTGVWSPACASLMKSDHHLKKVDRKVLVAGKRVSDRVYLRSHRI